MQYDVVESDDVVEIDRAVGDHHRGDRILDVHDFEAPSTPIVRGASVRRVRRRSTDFAVQAYDASSLSDGPDRAPDDEFMVMWPSGADDVTTAPTPTTTRHRGIAEGPPGPVGDVQRDLERSDHGRRAGRRDQCRPTGDRRARAHHPGDARSRPRSCNRRSSTTATPRSCADPGIRRIFAPPTIDVSVEAIYARAAAQMEAEAAAEWRCRGNRRAGRCDADVRRWTTSCRRADDAETSAPRRSTGSSAAFVARTADRPRRRL